MAYACLHMHMRMHMHLHMHMHMHMHMQHTSAHVHVHVHVKVSYQYVLLHPYTTPLPRARPPPSAHAPSQDGMLKVWRLRTGQCVRRFPKAHAQGITCVAFSRDSMQAPSRLAPTIARATRRAPAASPLSVPTFTTSAAPHFPASNLPLAGWPPAGGVGLV